LDVGVGHLRDVDEEAIAARLGGLGAVHVGAGEQLDGGLDPAARDCYKRLDLRRREEAGDESRVLGGGLKSLKRLYFSSIDERGRSSGNESCVRVNYAACLIRRGESNQTIRRRSHARARTPIIQQWESIKSYDSWGQYWGVQETMEEKHNGARCLTLRVAGGGRGHQEPEGEEDARGAHLCDVNFFKRRDGVCVALRKNGRSRGQLALVNAKVLKVAVG
jgi:hypothetical protein